MLCTVPDCEKQLRSPGALYCNTHYSRWYRHGSVDMVSSAKIVSVYTGRRYVQRYRPGHPLADRRGQVYAHRLALWDAIGPGRHPCHWCDRLLDWRLPKGDDDQLQVDHLNNTGDDNRPENLVACCQRCNKTRAAQRRMDALHALGFYSVHDDKASIRRPRVEAA